MGARGSVATAGTTSKTPKRKTKPAAFQTVLLGRPANETYFNQADAANSKPASTVMRMVQAAAAPASPRCFTKNHNKSPYAGISTRWILAVTSGLPKPCNKPNGTNATEFTSMPMARIRRTLEPLSAKSAPNHIRKISCAKATTRSKSGPNRMRSDFTDLRQSSSSFFFDPVASSELKAGKMVVARLLGTTEARVMASEGAV